MHRYLTRLSFNGSGYHGWQLQKNAPSIQEEVTNALERILSVKLSLVGCGRTDTGVHAREYFAHFDLEIEKTQRELDRLSHRINRFLFRDISISWIRKVPEDLHARFSALSRTYRYYIHTVKDPFLYDRSWYVNRVPDVGLMNSGAEMIRKNEDFTSFSKLHSSAITNICHITEAQWVKEGHRLIFTITADRFLRNMVRAIVGTLVDLGQGKITMDELKRIIEARNRSEAGKSVPAHGLFLERVTYPIDFMNGDSVQGPS